MSNSNRPQNDLALGAFIEYAKVAAYGAREDFIKQKNRIKNREYTMDELPQPLDTAELTDIIPCELTDLTSNDLLCKALRSLTSQEKRVLTLAILDERPMEEVRQALHISVKRVYELRSNALRKLRRAAIEESEGSK